MSFTDIRPYFKTVMKAVDKNLRESPEAFSFDKIPGYNKDLWFFLTIQPAQLVSFNQTLMMWDVPVSLEVWTKGYVDSNQAVDAGWDKAQAIIKEAVRHSRRLSQSFIKNVIPRECSVGAVGATNENLVQATISFTLRIAQETIT